MIEIEIIVQMNKNCPISTSTTQVSKFYMSFQIAIENNNNNDLLKRYAGTKKNINILKD